MDLAFGSCSSDSSSSSPSSNYSNNINYYNWQTTTDNIKRRNEIGI
jgi:hypothetical protein